MRTQVSERVKAGFASVLEGVFQDLQLPYFLGGSRRFSYDHEGSDTDYFVLCEDKQFMDNLISGLVEAGFRGSPNDPDYSTTEGFHFLVSLPGVVHVVILYKKDCYERLEEEHKQVEALVAGQPILRQMARALRQQDVKGGDVFRTLLRVASAG